MERTPLWTEGHEWTQFENQFLRFFCENGPKNLSYEQQVILVSVMLEAMDKALRSFEDPTEVIQ
ncbi:MAG TPA: hypothetical protein VLT36_16800 [Candidatus Dormibacteraeota bacterium]|nr:hypothetical protein [Candidatus Dormibacteraeota bacterium]